MYAALYTILHNVKYFDSEIEITVYAFVSSDICMLHMVELQVFLVLWQLLFEMMMLSHYKTNPRIILKTVSFCRTKM